MMRKIFYACSLALFLCGCGTDSKITGDEPGDNPGDNPGENPEEPTKPTPPAGLRQKVEEMNANLVTLKALTEAMARSSVRSLMQEAGGTRIVFQDGTEVTFVCDPECSAAPFISALEDGDVSYWVLASQAGTPWLKDAAGERMPVAGEVPVTDFDEEIHWTVKTADKPQAWQIVDADGKSVTATGEESVTMFRSAVVADGRAEVVLTDGRRLSAAVVSDLSTAATANCYVVSSPGRYVFDASVRGNGVGEESAAGFAPQIELADGMTADWLWTDAEGLVSGVSFDKQAGEIAFTLGEGKGNVLIALMQGGAVVWSWHIWATDAPQTMTYENGAVLMDRSLGAVAITAGSADAYGMYYQWGRKDPFYGGEKTETSAEAFLQAKNNTILNPAYTDLAWAYSNTAVTPADAAAHPTTFYNSKVGNGSDWLAKPMPKMWSAEKNLNDPCPAGYRVPDANVWDNFHANHNYVDEVSVWDGANFGMTYAFGGSAAWYPAQGYRMYSSGSIVGLRASTGGSGAYWSSKASAAKAYYLFFRSKISVGSINPDLDKERSYGYLVRCSKE